MSKTEAKQPCSSCPSSKSEPLRKNGKHGQLVLEVTFAEPIKDLLKDQNIKISSVNNFMGKSNLKNFSFHGELQHRFQSDGASRYVLYIFYENLKNLKDIKPNYLEIHFLQRKQPSIQRKQPSKQKDIKYGDGGCVCLPTSENFCVYSCSCNSAGTQCTGQCGPCNSNAIVTNSLQGAAGATLAQKKLGGELKTEIVAVAPGTTYHVEIKNQKLKFTAGAPNPRSV